MIADAVQHTDSGDIERLIRAAREGLSIDADPYHIVESLVSSAGVPEHVAHNAVKAAQLMNEWFGALDRGA